MNRNVRLFKEFLNDYPRVLSIVISVMLNRGQYKPTSSYWSSGLFVHSLDCILFSERILNPKRPDVFPRAQCQRSGSHDEEMIMDSAQSSTNCQTRLEKCHCLSFSPLWLAATGFYHLCWKHETLCLSSALLVLVCSCFCALCWG